MSAEDDRHWFYQKTVDAHCLGKRVDQVLDLASLAAPATWEDICISHVRDRGVLMMAGYQLVGYSRVIWGMCLYGEIERAAHATALMKKPAQQAWELAEDYFAFSVYAVKYVAERSEDITSQELVAPVVAELRSLEKERLFGKDQLALSEYFKDPFSHFQDYRGLHGEKDVLLAAIDDLAVLVSMWAYGSDSWTKNRLMTLSTPSVPISSVSPRATRTVGDGNVSEIVACVPLG